MNDVTSVTQIAGSLSVTAILLYGLWALVAGKVLTRSHHDDVAQVLKDSEARAWDETERAREELKANNAVLEHMAEAVSQLRESVDSIGRMGRK